MAEIESHICAFVIINPAYTLNSNFPFWLPPMGKAVTK